VTALRDVDLVVEENEIFGFLGPNGAGKSTTINILLDFVRPTTGQAKVMGMDAKAESTEIRRRTGVLPEGYSVYERLTGRQHVEFAIESKEAPDDPIDVLERVGIADAADRKAGGYSKGMRQRLILGLALVGDPDLLILDEPSSGLDPNGAREMREIVRSQAERGTTIFFSSHILSQVEQVCDRVGILNEGELVAVDTVDALREAAGGDAKLKVTATGLTDEAVDAVEALDGVHSVSVDADDLTIDCEDGVKSSVVTTLEDNGATVSDFSTEETSLEDLFMHYTEGGDAGRSVPSPTPDSDGGAQ
jgi:ABC-2 type transport system ATP-binding protein